MRRFAVVLFLLVACLVFNTPSVSLDAQQNGVAHPLTFAELTYGEVVQAVVADGAGGLWFGGFTCSTTLPTTSNAIQKTWAGQPCIRAGLLGRANSDGSVSYLSYFGGNGSSWISALARGPNGNLYVAGTTDSADFPATAAAFDRTCGSGGSCTNSTNDGFIAELSPDGAAIVFATYLGGAGNDSISSMAVDSSGRVHVAGSTTSPDLPITPGAMQATLDGTSNDFTGTDAFYARLNADGTALEYATYLGGSDADMANGVGVDSAGNAYVGGTTWSADFPTLNPASSQGASNSAPTGFLAKFTSTGPAYSTNVGPPGTGAAAAAVVGDHVYLAGSENSADFPGNTDSASNGNAYVAELSASTGAVTRSIALHGTIGTGAVGASLAVDQNGIAYLAGSFQGNDCDTCGPEASRYPTTWDAYKRQLSSGDRDAALSIIDFGSQMPTVRYSSMFGGAAADDGFAVAPDGSGGAFFGGESLGFNSVNGQPPPPMDPGAEDQAFIGHVGTAQVTMPTPPADIVLYAYERIEPTAISGDWHVDGSDSHAAGGFSLYEPDHGAPKVTRPAAYPANYFELTFLAEANTPYHLWMRLRADNDSYQNDSVWVQFSDSIDGGGNPIWRIHSTDGTFVSLEDCSGCGEQAWGWNDNGYGAPGQPVIFATSGWHTLRIQQREDGVRIDQIGLSSNQWANTAPGANKDDTTILPESYALPSSTTVANTPPAVTITNMKDGDTFSAPVTLYINATASDSDGTVTKVDLYANSTLLGTMTPAPNPFTYTFTWNNVPEGAYSVAAVATDNGGATTTSAPVSIDVVSGGHGGGGSLPEGWSDADVGPVGAAGYSTYSEGTFTVHGAGADVWGTSDAFHYLYMPLATDGKIIARVATVSNEAAWVKAGVMIRSSTSPSAAQAFMLVSSGRGVAFQRRLSDGNTTVSTPGTASTAPHWVSLVRTGGVIQGWESADGVNWTFVGSDTFTMPGTVLIGLAVSSHVQGTLATATFDNVKTQALPSGWGDNDIGSVPFAGNANDDNGTFTVTGSGADIWGTADAFNYAWHLMGANGTIVAHVASVDNVAAWVKAGVMIRDSFDPGSPQAFVLVSSARGVAFQRREVAGGTSVSTPGSASPAPHWVKLTRSGDTFTAYESADGSNWAEIGSDTISMAQSIYIGLAVTSHSTTSSATCTFDNVSIQ